jgi:hypothetical protein
MFPTGQANSPRTRFCPGMALLTLHSRPTRTPHVSPSLGPRIAGMLPGRIIEVLGKKVSLGPGKVGEVSSGVRVHSGIFVRVLCRFVLCY